VRARIAAQGVKIRMPRGGQFSRAVDIRPLAREGARHQNYIGDLPGFITVQGFLFDMSSLGAYADVREHGRQ
jgi:hypothetical protein